MVKVTIEMEDKEKVTKVIEGDNLVVIVTKEDVSDESVGVERVVGGRFGFFTLSAMLENLQETIDTLAEEMATRYDKATKALKIQDAIKDLIELMEETEKEIEKGDAN